MISIAKRREPTSLQQYRLQSNVQYDGPNFTSVKADIRTQLLKEQGYLCAYCMQRITDDPLKTKIEHWHSQATYPNEQLNYSNMLAVCSGNTQGCLHCDTKKANNDIQYNPSVPAHRIESKIKYSANGKIESSEADFDQALNNILGLNCARLVENRKETLEAVRIGLSIKAGTRTQAEINASINQWSSIDGDGYKKPYYGVALYFLRKRLSSCIS